MITKITRRQLRQLIKESLQQSTISPNTLNTVDISDDSPFMIRVYELWEPDRGSIEYYEDLVAKEFGPEYVEALAQQREKEAEQNAEQLPKPSLVIPGGRIPGDEEYFQRKEKREKPAGWSQPYRR